MKKIFFVLGTLMMLTFLLPQEAQAQCPQSADSNPCYSLASAGDCVCYSSGKLRFWLAVDLVRKAKPTMDESFGMSLGQYLQKYYRSDELSITYLGGSWSTGQSFRVEMGGSVIVVISDGL